MSHAPGAAPVGHLDDLAAPERLAVLGFRRWCDTGPAGVETLLDPGTQAPFNRLCGLCTTAARRPLMRHGQDCPCLGADECALATLILSATSGEREDALMLAMTMVRADRAPAVVAAAEATGLALRRLCLRSERNRTLH
jgi:hypothetical protein